MEDISQSLEVKSARPQLLTVPRGCGCDYHTVRRGEVGLGLGHGVWAARRPLIGDWPVTVLQVALLPAVAR